jgi:hypothetical protein
MAGASTAASSSVTATYDPDGHDWRAGSQKDWKRQNGGPYLGARITIIAAKSDHLLGPPFSDIDFRLRSADPHDKSKMLGKAIDGVGVAGHPVAQHLFRRR